MALKRNGREVFFNNPGSYLGVQSLQSGNFVKGRLRNRNVGGFDQRFSAYGNGALHPSAYIMPQKSGSISSYTRSSSNLTPSANLIPALPMQVSGSFQLVVTNAQLDQVVQLVASAVLELTGSANLAAAVAMEGAAIFNLSSSALLGGVIPIAGSASSQLSPSVSLNAQAFMIAEAGGPEALSPQGLARAVWNELMDDYNDVGTFGEQLKNLSGGGGGGGPSAAAIADAVWDEAINAHLTSGSAGKFVSDLAVELEKRLKTSVFLANQ